MEEAKVVRHKDPCLVLQEPGWPEEFFKEMLGNMSINGTEWIVEENDVCVLISCSGQAHSLFLATREVHLEGRDGYSKMKIA